MASLVVLLAPADNVAGPPRAVVGKSIRQLLIRSSTNVFFFVFSRLFAATTSVADGSHRIVASVVVVRSG